MKRGATRFLQVVDVLIGIGALTFMLWEPHIEGRNAHATTVEIYFKDPFLAYVYLGSIPFFVALYQVFKLLGYMRLTNEASSPRAIRAARVIGRSAKVSIGLVIVGEVLLRFGKDYEGPPALFMGMLATFGFVAIASAAAAFERRLRHGAGTGLSPQLELSPVAAGS